MNKVNKHKDLDKVLGHAARVTHALLHVILHVPISIITAVAANRLNNACYICTKTNFFINNTFIIQLI